MKKIIMDVDTALGLRGGDIDDAHAIALVAGSDELHRLAAICVSAGNVSLKSALRSTRLVRRQLGLGTQMGLGAPQPLKQALRTGASMFLQEENTEERWVLDVEEDAPCELRDSIEIMAEHVESGPCEFLPVAPLTNIARFFQACPDLAVRIDRIVSMGGWYADNAHPEFNIARDPDAAAIVYSANVPMVLVPIDMTGRARLAANEISHWAEMGPAASVYHAGTMDWLTHLRKLYNEPSCCLHDPLAAAALLWPGFYETKGIVPEVDESNGRTRIKAYDESSPIRLMTDFDEPEFKRLYMAAMERAFARSGQAQPAPAAANATARQ